MPNYKMHMYLNESRNRFFKWEPGDRLHESEYTMDVTNANSPEDAADMMFLAFNRDARPNGQVERSLSVSDVVVAIPTDEAHPAITMWCSSGGWVRISKEQLDLHHAVLNGNGG